MAESLYTASVLLRGAVMLVLLFGSLFETHVNNEETGL